MKPIEIGGEQYVLVPVKDLSEARAKCDVGVLSVPEVVSAKQFALMLRDGTKAVTVRRRCKDGELPAKQLGREWYVRAREAFGLQPAKTTKEEA